MSDPTQTYKLTCIKALDLKSLKELPTAGFNLTLTPTARFYSIIHDTAMFKNVGNFHR